MRLVTSRDEADETNRKTLENCVDKLRELEGAVVGVFVVVAFADGRTHVAHSYSDNQRLAGAVEIARARFLRDVVAES